MRQSSLEIIKFPGYFQHENSEEYHFICTIEYDYCKLSHLKIEIFLIGDEIEQRKAGNYLLSLKTNNIWIHSEDKYAPPVEILGIYGVKTQGSSITIEACAIQIGLTKTRLTQDTRYRIKVELTPSGILRKTGIRELKYTGEINFHPIDDGVAQVDSSVGTLNIEEQFAHYESKEYGNKVIKTIEKAVVTTVINFSEEKDFFAFNEELKSALEDICIMLSLCYRQPVTYYEIEYYPDREQYREPLPRLLYRRKYEVISDKIDQEELIHYRNLINGGIDKLTKTYRNFENKQGLSRAIRFLSESFLPTVSLESSYFFAYSALDSVVSALSADSRYLVGSGKRKIGEKISKICQVSNIKIDDLWVKDGFETGVRLATKIRNDLFHSALCKDPQELSEHLIRLRVLIERMILKALNWPDDQIWIWHDQQLKWTNKGSSVNT